MKETSLKKLIVFFSPLLLLILLASFPAMAEDTERTWHTDSRMDKDTGFTWCNAERYTDDYSFQRRILIKRDGAWYIMDKDWWALIIYKTDQYQIWQNYWAQEYNPLTNYWFDPKTDTISHRLNYNYSPDRKWAFINDFCNYMQKDYFIKDMQTGTISLFDLNNHTSALFWDKQNRLIYCKYSEQDRQNTIYAYYPVTKSIKKIINGTLRGYDEESNSLLFVKNEPTRQFFNYDLNSGKEKPLGWDWDQVYSGYSSYKENQIIYARSVKIDFPKDIDIESLPVYEVKKITDYQHNINISGKSYPVDYVLTINNQQYITLRPLASPLGIKIAIDMAPKGSISPDGRIYTINYKGQTVVLSADEYINLNWTLMVTPQALESIIQEKITISPILN